MGCHSNLSSHSKEKTKNKSGKKYKWTSDNKNNHTVGLYGKWANSLFSHERKNKNVNQKKKKRTQTSMFKVLDKFRILNYFFNILAILVALENFVLKIVQ